MSKTIVRLRVYRGKKILRDEDLKIQNQNQTVALTYDTREWHNFINKMYKNRFGVAKVESAKLQLNKSGEKAKYEDVSDDTFKKIDAEVQSKLKVISDKALTQDQKEIEALKAQVAKLVESNKGGDELKALKAEYKELNPTGKGVSPAWSKEEIEEKIAGFKA